MRDGNDADATADVFSIIVLPSQGKRIREVMRRVHQLFPEETKTEAETLLQVCDLALREVARLSR